jgi:hypothetical protein
MFAAQLDNGRLSNRQKKAFAFKKELTFDLSNPDPSDQEKRSASALNIRNRTKSRLRKPPKNSGKTRTSRNPNVKASSKTRAAARQNLQGSIDRLHNRARIYQNNHRMAVHEAQQELFKPNRQALDRNEG